MLNVLEKSPMTLSMVVVDAMSTGEVGMADGEFVVDVALSARGPRVRSIRIQLACVVEPSRTMHLARRCSCSTPP